jgi:hypothetical protein
MDREEQERNLNFLSTCSLSNRTLSRSLLDSSLSNKKPIEGTILSHLKNSSVKDDKSLKQSSLKILYFQDDELLNIPDIKTSDVGSHDQSKHGYERDEDIIYNPVVGRKTVKVDRKDI